MGLFSSNVSKDTCPAITTGPQYGATHVVASLTFHKLTIILCVAFTAITLLLSGLQLILHATHFSNPAQQTQILRIIAMVPTFAVVYLLAGSIPSTAIYLQPWADTYEAVALISYFYLLLTYTVPDPQLRDGFFDRLQQPKSNGGSLKWYHRTYSLVFQYIPISVIVAVVTDITEPVGKYCFNGDSVHFAHIWLVAIHTASVAIAFLRLLQFYKRMRAELKQHSVVPKLVAIKGVVFLSTLQTMLFSILSSTGAVKPSSTLSFDDFYFGIPSILICGEMVLFSLFNFYAYPIKPYSQPLKGGVHYYGGFLGIKALLAALNPMDLVSGMALAVQYLISSPKPTRAYDELPLHQGRDAGLPPAYVPQAPSNSERYQVRQEQSPNPVEYGRVDRYTPLPR